MVVEADARVYAALLELEVMLSKVKSHTSLVCFVLGAIWVVGDHEHGQNTTGGKKGWGQVHEGNMIEAYHMSMKMS